MKEKEYPPEVQKRINALSNYTENKKCTTFDILHLYVGEIAYPNGYCDSRFFHLIGFNTLTMEKRDLGRNHDGIRLDSSVSVRLVRIFADGSTLIAFTMPYTVKAESQEVFIF